jgi:hypothetical protein
MLNLEVHKEPMYLKGFNKKKKAGEQTMHSSGIAKRK